MLTNELIPAAKYTVPVTCYHAFGAHSFLLPFFREVVVFKCVVFVVLGGLQFYLHFCKTLVPVHCILSRCLQRHVLTAEGGRYELTINSSTSAFAVMLKPYMAKFMVSG